MKSIAFKVRTQGHYTGVNGGDIKKGGGGAGALWYEDKTFTIAATQDQWLCTLPPENNYTYNKPKMNPSTKPLRYLSVCSGMEAATVAWHHMGWTPVGFSEIEPFPSQILKHHYPHVPNYGDLTQYKQWPIEQGTVNLLIGGTPCQSYSIAGKRGGLNDPRGQLMFSFLDLADKLKPEWIIWENVPGVLSSGKPRGSDFGCLLQGLVERGYGFAYRILDARFFGVPQRRRRVFVVCRLGDWKAPAEILSLAEGLSGHLAKSDKKRKGITANVGESPEASGRLFNMQAIGEYGDKGIASTCKERDYKDATDLVVGALDTECGFSKATQQSVDAGHILPTVVDRAAFNQGENAQYKPIIEQTDTCPTIVSRGPHAIQLPIPIQDGREIEKKQNGLGVAKEGDPAYTIDTIGAQSIGVVYENRPTDSRITGPLDVAPTLTSRFGTGGGNIPLVNLEPRIIKLSELRLSGKITEQETCPTLTAGAKSGDSEPLAITFQPGNLRRDAGADPSTDTTTTLKATPGDQMPHVAYPLDLRNATRSPDKQDAMNRQGAGLGNDGDPSPTLTKGFVPGVAHPQGVDLYNQALTGDLHCPLRTAGGHGAPAVMAFDAFNQSVSTTSQTLSCSASDVNHTGAVFSPTMAVRRLTPRECERLQGFPDDYSMIPWKGKPAEQCPDGPRYKACGNSFAVPVVRWIGERIQKYIDGTL